MRRTTGAEGVSVNGRCASPGSTRRSTRTPTDTDGNTHGCTQLMQQRRPVLEKYRVALPCAKSAAFDRGGPPYQDANLLSQLRNRLTHARAETAGRIDIRTQVREVPDPHFRFNCRAEFHCCSRELSARYDALPNLSNVHHSGSCATKRSLIPAGATAPG
jgi:hypothetical protein